MNKKDFPIFANNPELVYLDSAATLQKPSYVIDGIKRYLENDYANVHRGRYSLSERSEELFWAARRKVGEWINAVDEEVIFTSSSTDSVNLLAQSLVVSGWLKKDDTIVLCEGDHHANIVPRQQAAEKAGCNLVWVGLTVGGQIDVSALQNIKDKGGMRLFACHMISNVVGVRNNMKKISEICGNQTLFVADASQAVVHDALDMKELGVDFAFFTGHKLGAHTGIGVLYGKKGLLKELVPSRGGGGSIASVSKDGFTVLGSPDKFEPGTPNLVGAISLLYALEYMEKVGGSKEGWYEKLGAYEDELIVYILDQFNKLQEHGVELIGGEIGRIGLFSFIVPKVDGKQQLGQYMALKDIAIRCGGQCAHPFHASFGQASGSCRISLWAYTEKKDVENFFKELRVWCEK